MELSLRLDIREMWIASLHVAVPFRSMGLGRQLVQAAEAIARAVGIAVVNVLPLYTSDPFWLKLGYRPHPCTVRVLCKQVGPASAGGRPDAAGAACGSRE